MSCLGLRGQKMREPIKVRGPITNVHSMSNHLTIFDQASANHSLVSNDMSFNWITDLLDD